jgi:chromosome segregation ATPase
MDRAQQYVGGRVIVFADLDASAAAPAQREFRVLNEAADTASAHYIQIVDAHDLDDPGRTPAEYDAARRALLAVTETLTKVTNDLNGFAARLTDKMSRLEAALDQLPPRLGAARDAVAAADAAIAAARGAGLDATEPEAELARARGALAVLSSQGLGGLGLAGALEQADEVRRLAEKAREEAAELPRAAEKVRNTLTSVRTRVQAVAGRIPAVQETMRQLLRNYSQACWQDLRGAPAAIEEGLVRARERIAEADAHIARAEWRPAQRALTAARTELSAADRRAGQVTGRLADLDAAAADPAKPADAARFVVRDAQKLVVTAGPDISPRHAKTLDALVERLEQAGRRLTGAHPDYWAYLQELEAIKTGARDVVARVREERSAGR